jgi:hypothetical protein
LCFDHVNGGGEQHRKEIGSGGGYIYAWLIKNDFPASIRLLCHNCNMAKSLYGYCPHKTFPTVRDSVPNGRSAAKVAGKPAK